MGLTDVTEHPFTAIRMAPFADVVYGPVTTEEEVSMRLSNSKKAKPGRVAKKGKTRSDTSRLTTYDWVYGIVTAWKSSSKIDKISINTMYNSFEKLARLNPKKLSKLSFEKVGDRVLSKDVEEVLFRLGAAGVVSVVNPRYRFMRIEKGSELSKKHIIQLRGERAWDEINALAEQFGKIVAEEVQDCV